MQGPEYKNIRIYADDHRVNVYLNGKNYQNTTFKADILILDMMGREILKTTTSSVQNEINIDQISNAYLIVRFITPYEAVSEKVYIQ